MNIPDGASSLQALSDDINQSECNPCKFEGISKDAEKFCPVCNENLCASCEQFHKKFSSTRKHETVSLNPVSKNECPRRQTISPQCSCDMKEVEIFCGCHNEIICSDCDLLKHRNCFTLAIEKACEAVDETFSELTDRKVDELRNRVSALQRNEASALQDLDKTTSECREEVKGYRRELNAELDKLERKALDELDKHDKEKRKFIQRRLDAADIILKKLECDKNLLREARTAGDRRHIFIRNLLLLKMMCHSNEILTEINRVSQDPSLIFTREIILNEAAESLGKISKEKRNNFVDKAVASLGTIDAEVQSDGNRPLICGSVFMPTGEMVICDGNNKKIKLLSKTFVLMNTIELVGKPWDIAATGDEEAVVTLPYYRTLQFIQVFPKLQKGHAIALEKECRGVAVSEGCIYVLFAEGEISVLRKNGELIKSICQQQNDTHPFLCPYYLSVSKKGNLYISCYGALNCVSPDGRTLYCYKDKRLSYGYGLYLDDDDNALVCGCYDNNMHLVGRDGRKLKIYLSKENGLNKPHTVCFREKDNVLIVGGETKDKLLFFRLENINKIVSRPTI